MKPRSVLSSFVLAPALALVAVLTAVLPAGAARDTPGQVPLVTSTPPAGMPAGVPPAATRAEPALPAPPASVWPFGETWSRTEGSGRLADGASFWTDYVYDDHGASYEGLPAGADSTVSSLAPTQGVYSYPTAAAHRNGADVFRSAVGLGADGSTYWRVDWNTLADPTVPAAEWVWGSPTDTTVTAWPRNAGVSSTGATSSLFVSSRGALLTVGSATTSLPVAVDTAARSFVVHVPAGLVATTAPTRLRMGSGLASADGTAFAAPTKPAVSALPAIPGVTPSLADNLMNVTYRTVGQEPPVYAGTQVSDATLAVLKTLTTVPGVDQLGADGQTRVIQGNFWMEDHQADALATGDVSDFGLTVDWSQLRARAATAEPAPTGYSNRWYVSPLDLGQGTVSDSGSGTGDLRPNYLGRVQPYAVYVPTGVTGPMPVTWVLHSLGVNVNQYGAYDPSLLQQLCQGRRSICATTEGFGPDLWYFDEGEADFWWVWHQLATAYSLDPERTVVGGYSMGGWAGWKLGVEHPDLYAQAYSLEGPPTCGVQVAGQVRGASGSGHCDADGTSMSRLPNARWLPYSFTAGVADQLVPVTSTLLQWQALDGLGYRYHFFTYPTEDHLAYAVQDRFDPVVATIGTGTRTTNPGHVTYGWFPDLTRTDLGIGSTTAYWVSGLAARDTTAGTLASVDATSAGRPDPAVTVARSTTPVTVPTPGTQQDLTWTPGATPAARDAVALTLTDVAALTVDARRAGLTCPTIAVTSDGAARLTVTGLAAGTRSYAVPAGGSSIAACTGVVTASGPGGASAAGTGSLAMTGGSPLVPLAATGLVAVGVAVRISRRRTP